VNKTQTYEGAYNSTDLCIRTFHLIFRCGHCTLALFDHNESIYKILTNHASSVDYLNYSSGFLCDPQPWKHFVNLLDSLFFSVRKSLRGLSGCFTRKCCMYTCQSKYLFTYDA